MSPDPTSELARSPQRPPEEGDPAPIVNALDEAERPVSTRDDAIAGRPILLLFCARPEDPATLAELAALTARSDWLAARRAEPFVLTPAPVAANRTWREARRLPFRVLSDGGNIFATYGVDAGAESLGPVVFVLDPDHRVARILAGPGAATAAAEAVAGLSPSSAPLRLKAQAPVLVLPRMLAPADCAFLIEVFHHPVRVWDSDGLNTPGFRNETGDFKVRHDGVYGRLVEYVVQDPELQRFLDSRLQRRLLPELKKAFQTVVSRREGYRISCYDASDGGELAPHRDDSIPRNAHRRFTMTVNLNAGDYEGGELRFPEYGDQLYDVERGTAIIWSASLLHEVLPIKRGQRFIVGAHMFGS